MFGKKDTQLQRKIDEQAALLRQYSDVLRSLIGHAGGVSYPGDGLIPPAVAEKTLHMAIDSLTGSATSPDQLKEGSEDRPLPSTVTRIKLAGAAAVVIRQGETPSMTVRCADKTFLPKVLTTVAGNSLTVDTEPVMVRNVASGRGLVAMGDIFNRGTTQVCVGNGNVQIAGHAIHNGSLGVEVSVVLPKVTMLEIAGAGRVTYQELRQAELSVDISGSGEAVLGGQVGRLEVEVSGAGDISAYALTAETARLSVSGVGSVQATVTDSVRARVSGSGKIKIAGNPEQRDTGTSGVGKIKFVER